MLRLASGARPTAPTNADAPRQPDPPQASPLSPDILSPTTTRSTSGTAGAVPPGIRSRSSTITSLSEDDYSSDSDSVLSWWSSDEDDSDASVDESKEADKKKRELERQKILSTAGLKLRREAPAPPTSSPARPGLARKATMGRRRPAPAAPKRRRRAPAVPAQSESEAIITPTLSDAEEKPEVVEDPEAATLDAYARYEQFLASASRPKPRPTPPPITRVESRPLSVDALSPQGTGGTSTLSVPSTGTGGGRLSTFFSKMMTGATTPTDRRSTPAISGPITKLDLPEPGEGAGGAEVGRTWSSLVDQGVLESMGERERKRQEVSTADEPSLCSVYHDPHVLSLNTRLGNLRVYRYGSGLQPRPAAHRGGEYDRTILVSSSPSTSSMSRVDACRSSTHPSSTSTSSTTRPSPSYSPTSKTSSSPIRRSYRPSNKGRRAVDCTSM